MRIPLTAMHGDTISFDFAITNETDGNGVSKFDAGSSISVTVTAVPDPNALSLFALGSLALLLRRRSLSLCI